jgi:signal transduction histidine kinase
LFRIAQEAVSNAIRHGRATHVRIDLAYQPECVVLKVTDDGCGFVAEERDPAPAIGEHLGLLTMRERAARVRGRLAILSSPGNGTTIETTVPLVAE